MSISYRITNCCEGVYSQQFSFSVPAADYTDTSGMFPTGCSVKLDCSLMSFPVFYVTGRKYSQSKLIFTCYDRTAFTEMIPEFSDKDFDSKDMISVSAVFEKIKHTCGFGGISAETENFPSMQKTDVKDKSAKSILTLISRTLIGYWTDQNGTLALIRPCVSSGAYFTAEKYSRLYTGARKSFDCIILENTYTGKTYTYGQASDANRITRSQSRYFTPELAGKIFEKTGGKAIVSWECRNIAALAYPAPSSTIVFGGQKMIVGSCQMKLSSFGCICSCGADAPDNSEMTFLTNTQHELEEKLQKNKTYSNVFINENGIVHKDSEVIYNSSEDAEKAGIWGSGADGEHITVSYGDGLFFDGDIQCKYPVMSREQLDGGVKFEYHKYFVTVYYTETDGKRTYTRWERVYKE